MYLNPGMHHVFTRALLLRNGQEKVTIEGWQQGVLRSRTIHSTS